MAIGLLSLAGSQCQFSNECHCCLVSTFATTPSIRPGFGGRALQNLGFSVRIPLFGAEQSFWYPGGRDLAISKVHVAADYSDSAADSNGDVSRESYHPLEDLKSNGKRRDVLLTDAEIARTTVEANSKAMLVFPGRVHCEPHGHISWEEFNYVIDESGDMFFELFDDENIFQDWRASNPVTVLIGMDVPITGKGMFGRNKFYDYMDDNDNIDVVVDDDFKEIVDTRITDTLIKWGMPSTLRHIHPIYFAKCLIKSVDSQHRKMTHRPSNRLSIMGFLRPAFVEEESYLRGLFRQNDDFSFDWRDESDKEEEQIAGVQGSVDGETNFNSREERSKTNSTLYKLEIISMELLSVYGDQSSIDLEDFQDAEPDILVHCASAIIERFNEYGMQCDSALISLCRKRKGLAVEAANLIGVDSLGMDVRVFSGLEARTIRFSFNTRAMTEASAENKIRKMLFPRYHRKKSRSPTFRVQDLSSH
ncbi:hypothetical protein HPP92_005110 [Vanilla planifolia]|uniref:Pentatricopeptide repeat (PPR) superfamily protein n=1 Tax=Vanilla planifolia TaxID=51239 RepID=A0A835RST9_VANPL|nr:hypothetical protein HPP92_005110 [Vanilla planifolia]